VQLRYLLSRDDAQILSTWETNFLVVGDEEREAPFAIRSVINDNLLVLSVSILILVRNHCSERAD
jgi:hypothetical protein